MSSEQGGLFGGVNPQRGGAEWVTAYCDGGSRGNPGPAGYGVFVEGPAGERLAELSEYLGKKTNNVAEYSGLLAALEWALQAGRPRLRVVADSELMVKQMQGRYKVASPDLRPLYEEAKRRVTQLEGFRIEHVLRGKNKNADRLANLAMDRGMGRSGGTGSGSASGGTARPGTGGPGGAGKEAAGSRPERSRAFPMSQNQGHGAPGSCETPPRSAKGYVKGGVVHLIEGELPEGAFVKVTLDRQ